MKLFLRLARGYLLLVITFGLFAAITNAESSLPPQLTLISNLELLGDLPLAKLKVLDEDVRQSSLNKIVGQCFLMLREGAIPPTNRTFHAGIVLNPSHIEYSKDFQTLFHNIGKMFTITFWAIFLPRTYNVDVMLDLD